MFVLFGVVSAAGLAIVIDRLLALAEDGLALHSDARIFAALTGLAIVIGGSLYPMFGGASERSVVIGTKTFDEQYILGHVIADRLQAGGIAATRREGLGSTVVFRALAAGDLDVYVDYSGTIWASEMKRSDAPGRAAVLGQMAEWMRKTYGIRLLGGLGFENAYAFAMPRAKADALHIKSLADLAAYAPR
ncbi:MAG: glycine betaine ABC transporter substrate-binding protein [Rhizomicrobium sp.]